MDRLNLKLAFSKFLSNESFSLDWKQVAKSTPLLQDMAALNSSNTFLNIWTPKPLL